jgi:hypothetical protein
MSNMGEQELCWDDFEWLKILESKLAARPIESVIDDLASALDPVVLRVYHGCRVADAGVFHREGLRINSPEALAEDVRRIVAEESDLAWLRPTIESRLVAFEHRDRDTGRSYVGVDHRALIEEAGPYALYGSEWILSFFGFGAHDILRRRGVPTIVEIDLPCRYMSPASRAEFGRQLLQEWTRVQVNRPDWLPVIDFTVILHVDLPPEAIVGHLHPAAVIDPLCQRVRRITAATHCPHCRDAYKA